MNKYTNTFAVALIAITFFGSSKINRPVANQANIGSSALQVMRMMKSAFAAGDATCDTDMESRVNRTMPAYQHGALSHFATMFHLLNNVFPSGAESALCHFNRSMEISPDTDALPVSVTKTFGTSSVTVDVIAPTDSWAVSLGYTAKATVTVDSVTFMVLYWGGSMTTSKGFMIEGPNGLGGSGGGSRASYFQWDRTDPDAQFVKVYAAKWTSSLSSDIAAEDSGTGAVYGEATYNTTSKAMTAQVVNLDQGRGADGSDFDCYKFVGSGTKDGQMSMAKETAAQALTDSNKDDTGMEGVYLTDSVDTVNVCQASPTALCRPLTGGELSTLADFTTSCQDLSTAGDSGGVFASDTVDFTTCPNNVFNNGGSCS